MKTVGVRELKNRLSEYIRQVRSGESVLVTDRGEVVAALTPPGHGTADRDVPAALLALAKRGLAWLLDETSGPEVRQLLAAAEAVAASDLTLIECDRVLLRAATLGELTESEAADASWKTGVVETFAVACLSALHLSSVIRALARRNPDSRPSAARSCGCASRSGWPAGRRR